MLSIDILNESLRRGRVFSSYLFVGPDGAGKRARAVEFAKTINHSDSENHPDIHIVEPKGVSSSIGIDEIREVKRKASLKPYGSGMKVFIIDRAHSLKPGAQNALLKILEEPPGRTVFMLVCRSEDLLLPTVVSRCQIVRFSGSTRMKNLVGRQSELIDNLLGGGKNSSGTSQKYPERSELKEDVEFLLSYIRDIFMYKLTRNEKNIFHADRIGQIKKYSAVCRTEELDRLIKKLITLESYIDCNVNLKIIVDVLENDMRSLTCTK